MTEDLNQAHSKSAEERIAYAEAQCGIVFPQSFLALLQLLPQLKLPLCARFHAFESAVNTEDIVLENQTEHDHGLPKFLVTFYNDGMGNNVCFDTRNKASGDEYRIVFWDHELTPEENMEACERRSDHPEGAGIVAESFSEWLAKCDAFSTQTETQQSDKPKRKRHTLWIVLGLLFALFATNFFFGSSIRRLLFKGDVAKIQGLLLSFQEAARAGDYEGMRKCFLPRIRDSLNDQKLESLKFERLTRAGQTPYYQCEINIGWTRTAGRLGVGNSWSAHQVYYLRREPTTKRWYFTGESDNYLD